MWDAIVNSIIEYPYIGVALAFLLCGMGLPLPEELVLLAGGYVCARIPEKAALHWMVAWCSGAILAGDLLPYVLGRTFGTRLLRLRWMRMLVTKQRLAKFDRWFRRRGDLVIFIARFLAGIRMVAFFTAGTMKMQFLRFLVLDGLGIALIVPLLVWIGHGSADFIDDTILKIRRVERGILWSIGALVVLAALWLWWRRAQRRRLRTAAPQESYVEPRVEVASGDGAPGPATGAAPAVEPPPRGEPPARSEPPRDG